MNSEVDTLLSRGFAFLARARFDNARTAFQQAVLVAPAHTIALYGIGFSELRRSNWRAALVFQTRAWQACDTDVSPRVLSEIHIARGLCQRNLGSQGSGATSYRRAAICEPWKGQGYSNLANALIDQAATASAKMPARFATIIDTGSANHWNTLARLLTMLDMEGRAEPSYRRAVVLDPAHEHAWNNLGILRKRLDTVDGALTCFQRAHKIQPNNSEVLANLGRNQLLTGDFANGWATLETPWRSRGFEPRERSFRLPVWDGAPLKGSRLLVWSEEKIGEEIMFSTMLDDIRARAGPITLLCNPRLAGLLAAGRPEVEVLGWDGSGEPPVDLTRFGACYPLEYLGRFVRRSFAEFPPPKAFLLPSHRPGRGSSAVPRSVGIHWSSINPLVGAYKSIPLRQWAPVLATPGIDFVSLQYGSVEHEIADVERLTGSAPRIPERIDQLVDVHGFADFIATLDLVISISGTTAHIAGGVGVPTWLLLPTGPGLGWYWFQDRLESPWYPNFTLYRQAKVRQWEPVLNQVARDLAPWRDRNR